MDCKAIVSVCCLALVVNAAHIPEVHETSISKPNQDSYEKPPTFNYQDYQQAQKGNQFDPQRIRYQQQQQLMDNNPQQAKQSELSTMQFTTTFIPTSIFNSKVNTTPPQMVLEGNHKSKTGKKNLYLVNEEEESVGSRQDDSTYINYIDRPSKSYGGYTHNGDQLIALSSLLGQTPENQLQGLQQLLGSNGQQRYQGGYSRDHTATLGDVVDYLNKPNSKVGRPSQGHSTQMINQALQPLATHSNNPDALKLLQDQLDATASANAESIIAQAQRKALDQVKAQHDAIARAQQQAEQIALEQINAQNKAFDRAHAQTEQEAEEKQHEEFKAREEKRKAVERRRQQEAARERARLAALAYKRKQEQEKKRKEEEDQEDNSHDTFTMTTRVKNAQKHKNVQNVQNIDSAETQNHYFSTQAQPQFHPIQHFPSAQTGPVPLHVPKAVTRHTHTPSASHVPAYELKYEPTPQYHTEENHAEIEKYYIPPQFTVIGHTKNEHGEDELKYAANYEFGYRIRDYDHGNDYGHTERKDGEITKGEYHALLPDGRTQTVSYYVDENGYHAEVTYDVQSIH